MIFFHQKMRNWYQGNYNKEKKNLYPFKQEGEKKNNDSKWTSPLMHF